MRLRLLQLIVIQIIFVGLKMLVYWQSSFVICALAFLLCGDLGPSASVFSAIFVMDKQDPEQFYKLHLEKCIAFLLKSFGVDSVEPLAMNLLVDLLKTSKKSSYSSYVCSYFKIRHEKQ